MQVYVTGTRNNLRLRGAITILHATGHTSPEDAELYGVEAGSVEKLANNSPRPVLLAREFIKAFLPGARQVEQARLFDVPGYARELPNIVMERAVPAEAHAHAQALQTMYRNAKERGGAWDASQFAKSMKQFEERARKLGASVREAGKSPPILLGTPGDVYREERDLLTQTIEHWKALGKLATQSATTVNERLLATQEQLSENVLKSLFRSYLDWSGAIPGSPESLLALMGGAAEQIPWNLPSSVLAWRDAAKKDAAILENQAETIKQLTRLRAFYLERAERAVEELKRWHEAREKRDQYITADQALRDALATCQDLRIHI